MDFWAYAETLFNTITNPKGHMGDFAHASRTFVRNDFRLSPKVKFLYHVFFSFSPALAAVLPTWDRKQHTIEAGLLVKSAGLPTFTANVETKKKYNRTKNIQTGITYNPITITFHDDNQGIIGGLLEAYYRYYFMDGNYGTSSSTKAAYQRNYQDSTYKNAKRNAWVYGLHRGITDPFFNNIQISQLTRKTYTTFTLVNPLITDWNYGDVNSSPGSEINENSITVAYESVWVERGAVRDGIAPKGFGDYAHYDYIASPNSMLGGGTASLGAVLSGGVDLFNYATTGIGFNNPIAATVAGINIVRNTAKLTVDGVIEEAKELATDVLVDTIEASVSGVPNTSFPTF